MLSMGVAEIRLHRSGNRELIFHLSCFSSTSCCCLKEKNKVEAFDLVNRRMYLMYKRCMKEWHLTTCVCVCVCVCVWNSVLLTIPVINFWIQWAHYIFFIEHFLWSSSSKTKWYYVYCFQSLPTFPWSGSSLSVLWKQNISLQVKLLFYCF